MPESDLDILIQSLAGNYLKTLQLVYELLPVVAALECDPYIERSKEITSFLEKYNKMKDTISNEIVTRAWIEQISKNIPRYEKHVSVKVKRIKANDFWLKNRFETA